MTLETLKETEIYLEKNTHNDIQLVDVHAVHRRFTVHRGALLLQRYKTMNCSARNLEAVYLCLCSTGGLCQNISETNPDVKLQCTEYNEKVKTIIS